MSKSFCLRLLLLLILALVLLLLPPAGGRSVQADDACLDCTTTCTNERQICLENGNPSADCYAAYKACNQYCLDNFCQLR